MSNAIRLKSKNGLDGNSITITNVQDPVNAQDAATKNWTTNNFSPANVAPGAVQARRTTTLVTTTTYVDITFDTVDTASNTSICNRDATNTNRFYAYSAGTYQIEAYVPVVASNAASVLSLRFLLNGTTALNPIVTERPASTTSNDDVHISTVITLAANDYVTLQCLHTTNSLTIQTNCTAQMKALQGAQGLQGIAGVPGGSNSIYYVASSLDSPNNTNWAINGLAPIYADPVNNALTIRAFDDTLEEGVGFTLYVPPSLTNMTFTYTARAATAPAGAVGAVFRLYSRLITINGSVGSWSSAYALATLSLPTNANFQTFTVTVPLSTLGITAGTTNQFEMTRYGASTSDTLVGDFDLLSLLVTFT